MWETIQAMAGDRLWIYTAIAGSLLGAAFLAWFKDTKAAIWANSKFDATLKFLVERWGWAWFKEDPEAWRKRYPMVVSKIDELEQRIKKLENKKK